MCASTEKLVPKEESSPHTYSRKNTLQLIELTCLQTEKTRASEFVGVPLGGPLTWFPRLCGPPVGGPTRHKVESFLPAHSGFMVCTPRVSTSSAVTQGSRDGRSGQARRPATFALGVGVNMAVGVSCHQWDPAFPLCVWWPGKGV